MNKFCRKFDLISLYDRISLQIFSKILLISDLMQRSASIEFDENCVECLRKKEETKDENIENQ